MQETAKFWRFMSFLLPSFAANWEKIPTNVIFESEKIWNFGGYFSEKAKFGLFGRQFSNLATNLWIWPLFQAFFQIWPLGHFQNLLATKVWIWPIWPRIWPPGNTAWHCLKLAGRVARFLRSLGANFSSFCSQISPTFLGLFEGGRWGVKPDFLGVLRQIYYQIILKFWRPAKKWNIFLVSTKNIFEWAKG